MAQISAAADSAPGSFVLDRRDWRGGIGRFLAETSPFLPPSASLTSRRRPTSPLAPLELAAALRRNGTGPFFSHGYLPPLRSAVPVAVTLHDLMYLRGHTAESRPRAAYMSMLKPLYRRCAAIVTMSEAARDDVADWLGGNVRVVAVGGGVGPQFHPPESPPTGRPVVMYVGSRARNKNIPGVLGGFARCTIGDAEFWVTGTEDEWRPHLEPFGSQLAGRVTFLGKVDDAKLAELYRAASALLIPSTEEGYGLPALEAMASGVPVIHSTDRALLEVVGGAGIAVEPDDLTAIGEALDTVLTGGALARDLVIQGRERAETMTWQAVADRIVGVVRSIGGEPPH